MCFLSALGSVSFLLSLESMVICALSAVSERGRGDLVGVLPYGVGDTGAPQTCVGGGLVHLVSKKTIHVLGKDTQLIYKYSFIGSYCSLFDPTRIDWLDIQSSLPAEAGTTEL